MASLLGTAALLALLLFAGVVATDPYDTGRFALLRAPGVPAQGPRTAHASRGRDPAFRAAILGNSHVQLLAPAELTAATGIPFVSLAVPGVGPREMVWLLHYFLRHHRESPPRALVLGIDPFWCRPDPAMPTWLPFPFWLYDPSPWPYLGGLFSSQALEDAGKRLSSRLGWSKRPRARPDGLWDYDEGLVWRPEKQGALLRVPSPSTIRNETGRFPALEWLGAELDRLPRSLPVVIVLPPVHATALPVPGSVLVRSEQACRAALDRTVANRQAVAVVDWRVDRPEVHVPENFIDPTHYRSAVARAVERDVAAALFALEARLTSDPASAGRPRE